MKIFVSICLLVAFVTTPNLADIRKAYPTAANSETTANEFASKMAGITASDDKVLVAYKGASLAMVSKFKKKIPQKISMLKEGAQLIESAVSAAPSNIEIRLVRLSVQENVPGITGYKKNIPEDKAFLLKQYKDQPEGLKTYIKAFISLSKSFSEQEKQTLK